jgi:Ala-tRNA(Pro) deacylase
MRIASYLVDHHIDCEVLLHPPAHTAQKRAKYLRIRGDQVAKSVLVRGPGGFVLVVLPSTRQVNLNRLADAVGGTVRLATAAEIADVFHDCEWGVTPPFGSLYGLPTLLDDGISPDARMVFETDARAEAVRLSCRDFERLEKPQRVPFAQPRAQSSKPPMDENSRRLPLAVLATQPFRRVIHMPCPTTPLPRPSSSPAPRARARVALA